MIHCKLIFVRSVSDGSRLISFSYRSYNNSNTIYFRKTILSLQNCMEQVEQWFIYFRSLRVQDWPDVFLIFLIEFISEFSWCEVLKYLMYLIDIILLFFSWVSFGKFPCTNYSFNSKHILFHSLLCDAEAGTLQHILLCQAGSPLNYADSGCYRKTERKHENIFLTLELANTS